MEISYLRTIGFSEGEAKVYLAMLEIGTSSLHSIHEKTGIDRRNIYDILNKLIEKGLVSYTLEKGKRTFQITHPNKIIDYLEDKKKDIETQQEKIQPHLPELISVFNEKKTKIRAEVFRGNESMKAILNEMLDYDESYWIGGNSGVEHINLKNWFKHWMKKRTRMKRMLYDLVDHGTYLEGLEPENIQAQKMMYYKRCELPKNLSSPLIIAIYGNKVAQILWGKQSFAFVLESKEIKESFMRYFNYFWKDPW